MDLFRLRKRSFGASGAISFVDRCFLPVTVGVRLMGEVGVGVLGGNILVIFWVCFELCAAEFELCAAEFVSGRNCEEYDAEEETPGGILCVDFSPDGVLRCNFSAIGCLARSGFTRTKF